MPCMTWLVELMAFVSRWKPVSSRKSTLAGWKHRLKSSARNSKLPNSDTLTELVRHISDKLDAVGHKDEASVPAAMESMLAEIIDKLDRLPKADTIADLRSIERVLQSLDTKLEPETGRSLGREIAVQVADEVVARSEKGFAFGAGGGRLAEQIAHIDESLEALSGLREMQDLMRQLSIRSAGPGDPSKDDQDEKSSSAVRASPSWPSSSAVPGVEALEAMDLSMSGEAQRTLKSLPPANQDEAALRQSGEDDVLLEPGAGRPNGFGTRGSRYGRSVRKRIRRFRPTSRRRVGPRIQHFRKRAAQNPPERGSRR